MKLVITLISFLSLVAQAAGGGEGVPVSLIAYQILNLALLFGVIFVFVRPKVKAYFAERKNVFEAEMKKTELARLEAEKQLKQISDKIAYIEQNSAQEIAKAQSEANQFKIALINEANENAKKIVEEANRLAAFELEKAKAEVRREMLDIALKAAAESVSAKMQNQDHQKLQASFIEKVGASKV